MKSNPAKLFIVPKKSTAPAFQSMTRKEPKKALQKEPPTEDDFEFLLRCGLEI